MNKLLILDKSVFQGTARNELVRFVKRHHVVLPHALCVECTISQKGSPPNDSKDPEQLEQKLLEVVEKGAYIGKSPGKIIREERSRNATIESLVDMEVTQTMREDILDEEPNFEKARKECEKAFKPITDSVEQLVGQCYKYIIKKGLEKDFRKEVDDSDLVERLTKSLQSIDGMKKEGILDSFLGDGSSAMSTDRWEWQLLRLNLAWVRELASKRNKSGSSFENYNEMSNDIFDIYYVAHLSQADGLLSRDKRLVQPLAKAAFPSKDVFGSINDVPYRY